MRPARKRAWARWACALGTAAGAAAAAGRAAARAPVPGQFAVVDVQCTPAYTISFGIDSAALDLGAQADLTAAAQWVARTPDGFLRIVGLDGGRYAPMGDARAGAAADFVTATGVDPTLVTVAAPGGLTRAEQRALGAPGTVVVLTCWGILP
jgi:hypothetical protein